MAAGLGTRLSPITDHLPKPLVPVGNRPALEHLLARLPAAGVTEVAINLHHHGDAVREAFGDGSALGLEIHWSYEPELLGTAGGAGPVADFLRAPDEPFLVLSGDGLHAIDLGELVRRHREAAAVATLTVLEIEDPSRFGVCVLDEDGLITEFQEKPPLAEARSRWASCGVYCFEPRVLDRLPAGQFYDWAKDVLPAMLADGDRLAAYRTDAYWSDIGTVADLLRANLDYVSGGLGLGAGASIDATAEIDPSASIEGAVSIAAGATVGAEAQIVGPVAIGAGARIGAGAALRDAVVLSHGVVAPGALVLGGIVGDIATLA
jgi:mannose-1-phosphate guanylyltransferase/mannose-1-phosphate guanylyltransferase/phosphomannomutase